MNDILSGARHGSVGAAVLLAALVSYACSSGGGGGSGQGAGGSASVGGNGQGAGQSEGGFAGFPGIGGAGAVPRFESDIVPIFEKTCGANDNACHSRVAYAATIASDCRGWLALEDEPLGSQVFADLPGGGGAGPTGSTGCPDMPLYERLTTLVAWEECDGVGKKYVVPCDVDASYLFDKIDDGPYCGDVSKKMPTDKDMPPIEKEIIRAWILAGAPRVDGTGIDCGGDGGAGGGANTGGSGPMVNAPVPTITHPGDGETRPAASSVPFIGAATDVEDGAITGSDLVWQSNLDGVLGTGETFSRTLSAGQHVITLTATDSDGNTATDSINLTMTP